jgi:hypothetical protein
MKCSVCYLQVSHRCQLEQGGYLVLPTTFEPGQESSFTLRVYSSKPLKLKWVVLTPNSGLHKAGINSLLSCCHFTQPFPVCLASYTVISYFYFRSWLLVSLFWTTCFD